MALILSMAAAAQAEKAGGLPQLNPEFFAGQLFWLAIAFVVLYLVISRVAAPRIATVLEERRDRIADDLDKASELKRQADAAAEAHEAALAEARAKAVGHMDEARRQLSAALDAQTKAAEEAMAAEAERAEARISKARSAALASIAGAASDAAAAIVQKLTGEAAPAGAVQTAVDAELKRG